MGSSLARPARGRRRGPAGIHEDGIPQVAHLVLRRRPGVEHERLRPRRVLAPAGQLGPVDPLDVGKLAGGEPADHLERHSPPRDQHHRRADQDRHHHDDQERAQPRLAPRAIAWPAPSDLRLPRPGSLPCAGLPRLGARTARDLFNLAHPAGRRHPGSSAGPHRHAAEPVEQHQLLGAKVSPCRDRWPGRAGRMGRGHASSTLAKASRPKR